jgi:hypothetical protein
MSESGMNLRSAAACAFRVALELLVGGFSLAVLAASAYAARSAERN